MSKLKYQWDVEQERITLFPFPGLIANGESIWELITGTLPEVVTTKPSLGISNVSGKYKNGQLVLNIDPQRIDFLYLPPADFHEKNPDRGFSIIDSAELIDLSLINDIGNWLGNAPQITRIAYGIVYLMRCDKKEDSYKILAELLPDIKIDIENSTDFMYSINRPRISNVVNNLKLNRYSKWAALKITLASIMPAQNTNISTFTENAARLELDISSDAERIDEIPKDHLLNLLKEMNQYAIEISQSGDIK